jgi:hypothetical protein
MLFAKISPTAKAATQDGAFIVHENTCEWMTANTQYSLGQEYTRFQISFGNFVVNTDPNEPALNIFDKLLTIFLDFTKEELSTWGQDDAVVFDIIAAKIGTTVVEVVDKPEITSV